MSEQNERQLKRKTLKPETAKTRDRHVQNYAVCIVSVINIAMSELQMNRN